MDEQRGPSFRIPHPGWWLLGGAILGVVVLLLRIGVPYWRQDLLIKEVKRLGGSVTTHPRGPAWLRNLVGDEAMQGFDEVRGLSLAGTPIDDAWLAQLRRFPEIEALSLNSTVVGDSGMAHLAGVRRLRELDLFGTRVGDAGLERLKHLPELRHIAAGYTNVTDAGLAY